MLSRTRNFEAVSKVEVHGGERSINLYFCSTIVTDCGFHCTEESRSNSTPGRIACHVDRGAVLAVEDAIARKAENSLRTVGLCFNSNKNISPVSIACS